MHFLKLCEHSTLRIKTLKTCIGLLFVFHGMTQCHCMKRFEFVLPVAFEVLHSSLATSLEVYSWRKMRLADQTQNDKNTRTQVTEFQPNACEMFRSLMNDVRASSLNTLYMEALFFDVGGNERK